MTNEKTVGSGIEPSDTTIVIPFHRSDRRLRRSITSVLNQTSDRWKLVLLSDGAEESFVSEIEREFSSDAVAVKHDGKNLGLGARLNESIMDCKTPYYMRMDADDVMHPERVARQTSFMDENPQVCVLGSSGYAVNDEDKVLGLFNYPVGYIEKPKLDPLKSGTPLLHPSLVFRTGWAKQNPYDSSYRRIEDLELWLRSYREGAFYVLDEPLIYVGLEKSQGIAKVRITCKEERRLSKAIYTRRADLMAFSVKSIAKEAAKVVMEVSGVAGALQARRYSGEEESPLVQTGQADLTRALEDE